MLNYSNNNNIFEKLETRVSPPPKLIRKGKYSVSFWSKVIWDKFASQRPLY